MKYPLLANLYRLFALTWAAPANKGYFVYSLLAGHVVNRGVPPLCGWYKVYRFYGLGS